ncbi:preprotein translocase subunit SecE [Alkalibacillus silvisoli]|uniref:Protein translocase subunit SecE n=1 Tax=Alkalibacillus silvisoli TaxID=392823 RepID=A0ABN1A886_9BACI
MFSFLKDVSREMRKVSWPKSNELTRYTIIVILTVVFVSIYFTVLDLGITQILERI